MTYSLVHFHPILWILDLVIVQFHYAPCTLQLGVVHFHYTKLIVGTFNLDYAPCTVVGALPPSTLYMAPSYDAVPVENLQIRMMQFHHSPCTMHYGMMHFYPVPCRVHLVTILFHHAPWTVHLGTVNFNYALWTVVRYISTTHLALWTLNSCSATK